MQNTVFEVMQEQKYTCLSPCHYTNNIPDVEANVLDVYFSTEI